MLIGFRLLCLWFGGLRVRRRPKTPPCMVAVWLGEVGVERFMFSRLAPFVPYNLSKHKRKDAHTHRTEAMTPQQEPSDLDFGRVTDAAGHARCIRLLPAQRMCLAEACAK